LPGARTSLSLPRDAVTTVSANLQQARQRLGFCVSTVSSVCATDVYSLRPARLPLIASRPTTAGSTDGADGTDAAFSTCAHPDHSRSCAAFTRERDLDAYGPGRTSALAATDRRAPADFLPTLCRSRCQRGRTPHTNLRDRTRFRSTCPVDHECTHASGY
jgi:hypothetical protein